jgi:hypothetical protein
MVEAIFTLLNSLTDEEIKRLAGKYLAFGSPEGNVVPVAEALKNLAYNRNLLSSLITENKLQQFPFTVQNTIHSTLSLIQQAIPPIDGGVNNFPALVQLIENLHFFVWNNNLHLISNERVDYESKLNIIKSLEMNLDNLFKEANKSYLNISEGAKTTAGFKQQAKDSNKQTSKQLENVKTLALQVNENYTQAINTNAQIAAVFTGVQQTEALVKQLQADATTGTAEINNIRTRIIAFYEDIDLHKRTMDESTAISNATLTSNKEETAKALKQHTDDVNKIITELGRQQKDIDDKLQKATGASLFHSFEQRKQAIYKGRKFWGVITGLLVVGMVFYNIDLFDLLSKTGFALTPVFWLRVTFNLPFVFAIGFASLQYSRERMLEEEYAFKSNISLSLEAYRELVERLLKDEKEAITNSVAQHARERLTTFIISAIDNIYSSPTVRVFGDKKKESKLTASTKELKEHWQTIEHIVNIMKPKAD